MSRILSRVLLLAILPVLLLSSCATGIPGFDFRNTNTFPEDFRYPYASGNLPGDFWQNVDALPGYGPHERTFYGSWPLPFIADKYHFSVSPDKQTATLRKYNMTGLGIPEVYLPLFFNTSKNVYTRGSTEPTGRASRYYHLFWSGSNMEGNPGEEPWFQAGGVPLFFDGGKEGGALWHFSDYEKELHTQFEDEYSTLIWWLGPAWTNRKTTKSYGIGDQTTETQAFVPLFAFKQLGIAVWSHYWTTTTHTDGTLINFNGHGPLYGLLWFDYKRDNPAKAGPTRWTGPLWGMFGKSQKATEYEVQHRINFLFLPIPYKTERAG